MSDDPAVKNRDKTAKRRPPGKPLEAGAPSANPHSRPKVSRNRSTLVLEALLDGSDEKLIRKAIRMALSGDPAILRALLPLLLPPRKERAVSLDLPRIYTAADALEASKQILVGKHGAEYQGWFDCASDPVDARWSHWLADGFQVPRC
jgi:hypothetical protein